MAVDNIYLVPPEHLHQPTHCRRVDGAFEPKCLRSRTNASEKLTQPADPVSRQYGNDSMTAPPELDQVGAGDEAAGADVVGGDEEVSRQAARLE